jgi:hypothetical protein
MSAAPRRLLDLSPAVLCRSCLRPVPLTMFLTAWGDRLPAADCPNCGESVQLAIAS